MQKTAGSRVWVFAGGIWLLGMVACGGGGSSTPAASTTPPSFTTTAPTTATVGTPYTYTPAASEAGTTVTISATSPLPAGATFQGGVLSWTPTPGEASQACAFTLQASDAKGTSTTQSWTVTPLPNPNILTGTVASGAPVAGTVTVKDANGHTASATIGTSGHYSLDVSSLTAPYILWASGTANGNSASMYSTSATIGTINITPITNLILATALNATPDAAYAAWTGTQVTTSAVATAKAQVLKNIAPLLTGAGVATGTDPMTATFNADNTGLDAALDLLNISYAGGSATVTNNATGSTYAENLANPATTTGLPVADAIATQTAQTDLQGIKALFTTFASPWATTMPTSQQIQTAIGPLIANGFLMDGQTATQWMTGTLDSAFTSEVGFTLTPSIQGPLTVPGFTRAYSVNLSLASGSETRSGGSVQVVLNGATWQLFGDQQWLTEDIYAEAFEYIDASGKASFSTGLQLPMQDPTGYAYNNGARSAIVTGPGLGNGLVFASGFPSKAFYIVSGGWEFNISDDAIIQTIPDNAVYTVALYAQPAGAVSTKDTPLNSFKTKGGKAPYLNAELNQTLFPQLIAPATHALSYMNIPGKATVSWTAPANTPVISIGLSSNLFYFDQTVASGTSAVFDTTSMSGTGLTQANLILSVSDKYGRNNFLAWALQ